jgi:hypothetical protein
MCNVSEFSRWIKDNETRDIADWTGRPNLDLSTENTYRHPHLKSFAFISRKVHERRRNPYSRFMTSDSYERTWCWCHFGFLLRLFSQNNHTLSIDESANATQQQNPSKLYTASDQWNVISYVSILFITRTSDFLALLTWIDPTTKLMDYEALSRVNPLARDHTLLISTDDPQTFVDQSTMFRFLSEFEFW